MNYFNSISFDVEEWYHANYDDVELGQYINQETNLESNVSRLLEICDKYKIQSTCFILGSVAKHKPHIVKMLHSAGHEIASHGYGHKLVYKMTESEFQEDLKQSKQLLEDLIGEPITGFRAPSWSVRRENMGWFYNSLQEQGIKYSSSVYPAYTYLYGVPGFPRMPHYPLINGERVGVIEVPVPVFGALNQYIGYSGGFYLRFFPVKLINYLIKKQNKRGLSIFLYLHPREIDIFQPKLKLNHLERFIHYYGINTCEKKVEYLIKSFSDSMVTISSGLKNIQNIQ